MPKKIAVQLEDGQIITYQTNAQNDKELVTEIKRLFPFAKAWHKEFSVDAESYPHFSLNQVKSIDSRSSNTRQRWGVLLILLAVVILGIYFKDVIYTEIQVQIIRYQIKRSVIDLLQRQSAVMPTPTMTAGSKRSDIILISSTKQDLAGFVKVVGEVQNFSRRSYDSIKVQVIFYDQRGNEVITTYGFVEPNRLEPEEQGRFSIMAENNQGEIQYYKAMILD